MYFFFLFFVLFMFALVPGKQTSPRAVMGIFWPIPTFKITVCQASAPDAAICLFYFVTLTFVTWKNKLLLYNVRYELNEVLDG